MKRLFDEEKGLIFEIDDEGNVVKTIDVNNVEPKRSLVRRILESSIILGVASGFAGTAGYKIGKMRGRKEAFAMNQPNAIAEIETNTFENPVDIADNIVGSIGE